MKPCSKCGFDGKVNAWRIARLLGKTQIIIPCPRCGGRGRQTLPVIRTMLWFWAVGGILARKARHAFLVWRLRRRLASR